MNFRRPSKPVSVNVAGALLGAISLCLFEGYIMVTRQEVKDFLGRVLRKWLFPDFNNKLTWWVAGLGGTVILAATPLKVLLCEWIIGSVILSSGMNASLAKFGEDNVDYRWGVALVFLALTHNIVIRFVSSWLEEKKNGREAVATADRVAVDRVLYTRFLEEFPASGRSVRLLKEHNFENTFRDADTAEVERFVHHGYDVDREFLDEELEVERQDLLNKCRGFLRYMNIHSGPGALADSYTCIPELYRCEYNLPDHVNVAIRKLNEDGSACYEAHTNFIRKARLKLAC